MPTLPFIKPRGVTALTDESSHYTHELLRRALEIVRRSTSAGNYVRPKTFNAGVLVVFCLIAGSLAMLVWWLFVKRSGFIWRASDWQDYKASVLRRPDERPDDAITVFSDGTARRGGGSTVGTRTVVLGELDTTYTKSYVSTEKPYGPRSLPTSRVMAKKNKGILESVWGRSESMWGRLRGGARSDIRTEAEPQRVPERRRSSRRRSRRHDSRRRSSRRRHRRHRKEEEEAERKTTADSFVDNQVPAPPLTNLTNSDAGVRMPTRAGKAAVTREPSYVAGDDRGGARYHRHYRNQSAVEEESSDSETTSDESSTDDDSDSDGDDVSELDQSQIGMAKGNKVYHHPISKERIFWGNAQPMERKGDGAGGTFGGGVPAIMPKGYRAGSVGSLSSNSSVGSSNAGL